MKLDGARVLLTGATGGLGQAIARALAERGAIADAHGAPRRRAGAAGVRGRRARDRGRPVGAGRARAAAGGGRRGRRAGRQRGDARERAADVVLRRGDRPRAERQPARADAARARADRRRWSRAAAGTCCSCPRCPAAPARRGSSVYSATKFGLRGFSLALREDLAPKGVGVSVVLPGLHPRRGDVRRLRRASCRRSSARSGRRTSPARSSRRSSTTAPSSTSRRCRCARARSWPALAPGPVGTVQRKLGRRRGPPARSRTSAGRQARARGAAERVPRGTRGHRGPRRAVRVRTGCSCRASRSSGAGIRAAAGGAAPRCRLRYGSRCRRAPTARRRASSRLRRSAADSVRALRVQALVARSRSGRCSRSQSKKSPHLAAQVQRVPPMSIAPASVASRTISLDLLGRVVDARASAARSARRSGCRRRSACAPPRAARAGAACAARSRARPSRRASAPRGTR